MPPCCRPSTAWEDRHEPGAFVELPRLLVFSPLGLTLVDDFTGDDPIGFVRPTLEVQDDAGNCSDTGIQGLFTSSGILAYPNLGRRGKLPAHENPRNYRVRMATQYYRPYNPDLWANPNHDLKPSDIVPPDDWFPFQVPPFTGNSDPKDLKATRGTLRLLPGPNYPFLGVVGILRGVVQGGISGKPIPGGWWRASSPSTIRRYPQHRRAVPWPTPIPAGRPARPAHTGSPCAWGDPKMTLKTTVRATDPKTLKQSNSVVIPFPYDLTNPQTITIPTL